MTFDQLVAAPEQEGKDIVVLDRWAEDRTEGRRFNRSRDRARYRYYEGPRSGPAVTAERREILLEGLIDMGSRALHDRLERIRRVDRFELHQFSERILPLRRPPEKDDHDDRAADGRGELGDR